MIAPTISATTSSQLHILSLAHLSPYSLPMPIAKAQATPLKHTGASRCPISPWYEVTTSDIHTNNAMPADANAAAVAQTNRCFIGSLIATPYLYHLRVVLSHIIVQQLIFSIEISNLLLVLLSNIVALKRIEFHLSQCLKHYLTRQGV